MASCHFHESSSITRIGVAERVCPARTCAPDDLTRLWRLFLPLGSMLRPLVNRFKQNFTRPDESARFKRREKKCGKMQHCPFGRISYNLAYSRCGCTLLAWRVHDE